MKKILSIFLIAFFVLTNSLSASATVQVQSADPSIAAIRCGVVSGDTLADGSSSGSGTIYGDPYKGTQIALADANGVFTLRPFNSEIGYALSGITAGNMYDLYVYWNGTAVQFDTPVVWPTVNTLPSRQVVQTATLKSGDKTRRLVASFYATGTNLTMSWSGARYLSNHQNKEAMALSAINSNQWTYGTNAWNVADGFTTLGVQNFGACYDDASHYTSMNFSGSLGASSGAVLGYGIGLDGPTINVVGFINPSVAITSEIVLPYVVTSETAGTGLGIGAGKHTFGIYTEANGSSTYGDNIFYGVVNN